MRTFLWKYRARLIPLTFLVLYEAILLAVHAEFEAHFIVWICLTLSFVSWPDDTPESEGFFGYHPLPEPWDLLLAVGLMLLPGAMMLVYLFSSK